MSLRRKPVQRYTIADISKLSEERSKLKRLQEIEPTQARASRLESIAKHLNQLHRTVYVRDTDKIASAFEKKASLETDMAKRVMLSVIPHLMSGTERTATHGFDPKALYSAAQGAADLVHYGALACYDELKYYPSKARNGYLGDKSEKLETQYTKTVDGAHAAVETKDWGTVLKICHKAFLNEDAWEHMYGGTAWAKIADTLIKINDRYLRLVRNPSMRYTEEGIELMKDIIVYMNVFDGLAHNSGSIMPKVIYRELSDKPELAPEDVGEYGDHGYRSGQQMYKQRIESLMDAKELDDPVDVYKEIEHIISQSPYRMQFNDWISKIRMHPDYNFKPYSKELIKSKLEKIRLRKDLLRIKDSLDGSLEKVREELRNALGIKIPKNINEFGISALMPQLLFSKKDMIETFIDQIVRLASHIFSVRSSASLILNDDGSRIRQVESLDALYDKANKFSERLYYKFRDWKLYGESAIPEQFSDKKLVEYYEFAKQLVVDTKQIVDTIM